MSIGDALEAFRASESDADRGRLAGLVRSRLVKAVQHGGVPERDLEDVVQDKVGPLLNILTGGAALANPDALTWRAGVNAANDWHRRQGRGVRALIKQVDPQELARLQVHAGDDRDATGEEMLKAVERALADAQMPSVHREVLRAHYFKGTSIEALASREHEEHPTSRSGKPRTQVQARWVVDQRLKRARDWVGARILEAQREEEGSP